MNRPMALRLLLALALSLAGIRGARAATSLEVGMGSLGTDHEAVRLFQLGVRAGPARGGKWDAEAALSIFPTLATQGGLFGVLDLGLAFPLGAEEGAAFVPAAGISALGIGSIEGVGAVFGLHLGVGLVIPLPGAIAMRSDLVYRTLPTGGGRTSLTSLTVGLVWHR